MEQMQKIKSIKTILVTNTRSFTDNKNRVGLSDILQNHRSPLAVMHDRKEDNLSILTSGRLPANCFDLFNSIKMKESMQTLKEKFDKIIIHGPPFFFTEATSLAAQVDGVVLLIHPGYNKTETSRAIIDKFQQTGATMIGIVMREQPKHQATQSAFIDQLLTYDKRARLYS